MLKYSVSRDPEVGFEGFTFLHLQQFLLQIFLEELMPPSNSSDFWNNLLSSAMMHLSPGCSLTSFYHAQVLSSTSWTISLAWSISAQYSTLCYFHWSVLDGQSCSISHSLMLEKKKLLQTWTWLFKAGFASHAFLKYALEVGFKKKYSADRSPKMHASTHLVATSMISSLKYSPGFNFCMAVQDNVVWVDISSSSGCSYLSSACGDIYKFKLY